VNFFSTIFTPLQAVFHTPMPQRNYEAINKQMLRDRNNSVYGMNISTFEARDFAFISLTIYPPTLSKGCKIVRNAKVLLTLHSKKP